MPTTDSPLLTVVEAAAYLRRSRSWLLANAEAIGVVRAKGATGKMAFLRADLDAWIERNRTQQPTEPAPPAPLRTVSRGTAITTTRRLRPAGGQG